MHRFASIRTILVAACLCLPVAVHAQSAPANWPAGPQPLDYARGMNAMLVEDRAREVDLNVKLAQAAAQLAADADTISHLQDQVRLLTPSAPAPSPAAATPAPAVSPALVRPGRHARPTGR